MSKIARRHLGKCEDCGHEKPVRYIRFWVNNMPYRVCEECEIPYRSRICWPVTEEQQPLGWLLHQRRTARIKSTRRAK